MKSLFTVAALLQGALILVDELVFHRKRGLPRWERIGHPVDSVSFLIPLGILLFLNPSDAVKALYVASAAFSCLCVTKDEWIHHSRTSPAENWIHSALFILHPTILIAGYASWEDPSPLLPYQFAAVAGFTIYQLAYWNYDANTTIA